MSTAHTYVRARIDTSTKGRAAEERRLPFEVKVPNATIRKAIAELEAGKGKCFTSVEALIADLNAGD